MSSSARNGIQAAKQAAIDRGIALDQLGNKTADMEDASRTNLKTAKSTTIQQMLNLYRFGGYNFIKIDLQSEINDARKAYQKGGKDAMKNLKKWKDFLSKLNQIHPYLEPNPARTAFIEENTAAILVAENPSQALLITQKEISSKGSNPSEKKYNAKNGAPKIAEPTESRIIGASSNPPSTETRPIEKLRQHQQEDIRSIDTQLEKDENFERPTNKLGQLSIKKIILACVTFTVTGFFGGLFISSLSGSAAATSMIEGVSIAGLAIPGVQIAVAITMTLIALACLAYVAKNACSPCSTGGNVPYSLLPSTMSNSSSAETTATLGRNNPSSALSTNLSQKQNTSPSGKTFRDAPAQRFTSQQFANPTNKTIENPNNKGGKNNIRPGS